MAALDFPSSPTVGQQYPSPAVAGVPVYTWDGEKWTTKGGAIGSTGGSNTSPVMDGTAAAGSSTEWSRGDHRHPSDTSRVAKTGDTMSGPLNFTAPSHWAFAVGVGAGSYYSTSGTVDAFFMGTDAVTDQFRLYTGGVGNVFSVNRATGNFVFQVDTTIQKASPVLSLDTVGDNQANLIYRRGGSPRWQLTCQAGAEGGGASGSTGNDWLLCRFNNSGGFIDVAFSVARADAKVSGTSIATSVEYLNNTSGKVLTTDKVWAAANPQTLTDAATVTPDFSTGLNFQWSFNTAGRTLANPINAKQGQCGTILFVNSGGAATITSWGSMWKFAGGAKPTLTATAGAIDILSYYVQNPGAFIICTFNADVR